MLAVLCVRGSGPPPPYSAHADGMEEEPGGAGGDCGASHVDVDALQRRLQQLQAELQRAFDVGDSAASASLAQSVLQLTQRLKAAQAAVEQRAVLDSAEAVWLSSQLSKVNDIKGVVEQRRREVEAMQSQLHAALTRTQQTPSSHPASHSSSSLFSSVFSSHSSSSSAPSSSSSAASSSSPVPLSCSALLLRARRVCRECQLVLEQQVLRVDSIDMNEHPATLLQAAAAAASPSTSPPPSRSLQSMKAVRKEVVTYIQSQLQHVDAFDTHLLHMEQALAFLDNKPRPSYAGGAAEEGKSEPQQRSHVEQKGSANNSSKKAKNARR